MFTSKLEPVKLTKCQTLKTFAFQFVVTYLEMFWGISMHDPLPRPPNSFARCWVGLDGPVSVDQTKHHCEKGDGWGHVVDAFCTWTRKAQCDITYPPTTLPNCNWFEPNLHPPDLLRHPNKITSNNATQAAPTENRSWHDGTIYDHASMRNHLSTYICPKHVSNACMA